VYNANLTSSKRSAGMRVSISGAGLSLLAYKPPNIGTFTATGEDITRWVSSLKTDCGSKQEHFSGTLRSVNEGPSSEGNRSSGPRQIGRSGCTSCQHTGAHNIVTGMLLLCCCCTVYCPATAPVPLLSARPLPTSRSCHTQLVIKNWNNSVLRVAASFHPHSSPAECQHAMSALRVLCTHAGVVHFQ
jgi:hypothetical protein